MSMRIGMRKVDLNKYWKNLSLLDVGERRKPLQILLFLDPLISEAIFVNYLVLFARYEPVNNSMVYQSLAFT